MKRRTWIARIAVLAVALFVAAPGFAADWPSFRNDASNAGASAEVINVPLTESWHSSAPDVEENGAVVANGIVYMLSEDGVLYAFQLANGFDVPGFPVNVGFTYSTPAVDAANGKVYVVTGSGFQAFNLNGTPAWTGPGASGSNYNQGPVIDEGFVYWNGGGSLHKYDSAGTPQWSTPGTSDSVQPAIMGGYVYTNTGGAIKKFDKATGVEVTTGGFPIATGSSQASIAAVNGRLFHKADVLYAYNASDGSFAWSQPAGGDATFYDSPAVSGGVVYVYGWDSKLYAFDEATGAPMAGFPSVDLSIPGDRNWSSPSVAGDKVFVGAGTSQQLRVLGAAGSASAGLVLDSHLTFSTDLQGFDLCSPVVSDGFVLIMLDGGGLYAFFGGEGEPPAGGLVINDGADCTELQDVTLTINNNGNPDVNEMRVSEDPFFTGAAFEPYAATKVWTLSPGFGAKTVYVQLRTTGGQLSNVFTDQIDFLEDCGECQPEPEICDNQIDDDCDGLVDAEDEDDCADLYVVLGAFSPVPDDGRVTINWNTLAELETAGFYLLRHDVLSGETVRLNQGLIPAQGDVFYGASYQFVDTTAVNGVQYEYQLVDVDRRAKETRHESVAAIANPINPRIQLLAPAYGATLSMNGKTEFTWMPAPFLGGSLRISTDAAFPVGTTVTIALSARQTAAGSLTLNRRQQAEVLDLAAGNGGVLYWKIVGPSFGSAPGHSATLRYAYDLSDSGGKSLVGKPTMVSAKPRLSR